MLVVPWLKAVSRGVSLRVPAVQSQAIYVGRSGTGKWVSCSTSIYPCHYHSTNV